MSSGDTKSALADFKKKYALLQADNSELTSELEIVKSQLSQYRQVNETQKMALKDKDSLLEQLREVNESLQNDMKTLKEVKPAAPSGVGFPALESNPWTGDGTTEQYPEQYRKLFVGGLNYDTTNDGLHEYFSKFGTIEKASVMMDNKQQSRGFGFVLYDRACMVDTAQASRPHTVDGRRVDTKRALPREETDKNEKSGMVKKLFVGGFRNDATEQDLSDYFSAFGTLDRVEMMYYKDTGKNRGFAFVYFDDYDIVDKLVLIKHHVIKGNRCSVKKAVPMTNRGRDSNSGGGMGGGNQRNFGNQGGGNFGGNQGGNMGGNQGSYGGNQGGFGGNQGGYGGNQGGFGGNQGGNMGGNQGGFNGNQGGNMGGNQGGYGGNQGGNMGGNQGNFGGNQGSYGNNNQGGNYGNNQGNFGNPGNDGGNRGNQGGNYSNDQSPNASNTSGQSGDVPPEMAAMWSAFYHQYMTTTQSQGGGPMRSGSGSSGNRSEPYQSGGSNSGANNFDQSKMDH